MADHSDEAYITDSEVLGRAFFVLDWANLKEEGMSDLEIPVAFHPALPLVQQVHIILLAQSMLPFARNFTNQPVRVLQGQRFKMAYRTLIDGAGREASDGIMGHDDQQNEEEIGGLVMVLSGRHSESDAALLRHLSLLHSLLRFCHGPLGPLLAPYLALTSPRTKLQSAVQQLIAPLHSLLGRFHSSPIKVAPFAITQLQPQYHFASHVVKAHQLIAAAKKHSLGAAKGACVLHRSRVVCSDLPRLMTRLTASLLLSPSGTTPTSLPHLTLLPDLASEDATSSSVNPHYRDELLRVHLDGLIGGEEPLLPPSPNSLNLPGSVPVAALHIHAHTEMFYLVTLLAESTLPAVHSAAAALSTFLRTRTEETEELRHLLDATAVRSAVFVPDRLDPVEDAANWMSLEVASERGEATAAMGEAMQDGARATSDDNHWQRFMGALNEAHDVFAAKRGVRSIVLRHPHHRGVGSAAVLARQHLERESFVQVTAEPFEDFERRCRDSLKSFDGQETLNFF